MRPLIIFDLDGTLAESKQAITDTMADTLTRLLAVTKVAVISGGALTQLETQVAKRLGNGAHFENLYLLPTSGGALYEYTQGVPHKIYEERLSEEDAHAIESTMRSVGIDTKLVDFKEKAYGDRIEYRGSQVTLSALGQRAPLSIKAEWDPTHQKREALQKALATALPQFSVAIGGLTSIDVTRPGIDKAYGVRKLCERLEVKESEALYMGDELTKNGNDAAVYKTSVKTESVRNPEDTRRIIEMLLTNH